MKVAIITSPNRDNSVRGIGVYSRRLVEELKRLPNLELIDVGFDYWRYDYANYDLVHFLFFDPFFLTLPPLRNRKTIVSVMDLTPIVLSDLYPKGIKGEIKWQIQKFLLSHVSHIVTLTNSAKRDIEKIINYPTKDITVTYLAPSEYSVVPKLKKDNFALYVGDVNPNKNLAKLLEALPLVQDKTFKLMLVGKTLKDSNIPEATSLRKKIKDLGIEDRVRIPGFVEDKDLVVLFAKAKMFIHPAIYEGFGLGALQALSSGLPVICGDNSSMPEVVGKAAFFADVTNPRDIAAKIDHVLVLSPRQLAEVASRAKEQAEKFTWKKTALDTINAYEKVLGN